MCFVDTSFIPELKVDITYQDLLEFLHTYWYVFCTLKKEITVENIFF